VNRDFRGLLETLRRVTEVSGAFIRMGYITSMSYPLSFAADQLATLGPIVTYYFVAQLVSIPGGNVGGDYYTFVIIGLLTARLLAGSLRGVGDELEDAVKEGRFEALLVQPVPWRALPFGLVQWPIIWRLINVLLAAFVALALGAHFRLESLPVVLLVLALGLTATMAIGNIAAGVKLLAKRTDPILTFYGIAVVIFSGVAYPITVLPSYVRVFSYLIPETYVIGALRQSLMPQGAALPGPSPTAVVVGLVVFNLILFPFSLWMFGRTLEWGRKTGLLGGY
jgi:ABC-2 type transport system permease protein